MLPRHRDCSRSTLAAQVENIADLMQCSRVIEAGLDVDGDGIVDLNPNRLYYYGHSLGGMYGIGFFAYTPEVRAAFSSPLGTAPRLRLRPPAGITPRPFVLSFARGDTASPNPNTSKIIRAGAFDDRVAFYYLHDRYWADNPVVQRTHTAFQHNWWLLFRRM